jgi:hypothetical protein
VSITGYTPELDVSDLTGAEIAARLVPLEEEERRVSRERRRLHDRIDFIRGNGVHDPATFDQLATLSGQEREISDRRRAMHREIDALRAELQRRDSSA